jgi:hemolysin III
LKSGVRVLIGLALFKYEAKKIQMSETAPLANEKPAPQPHYHVDELVNALTHGAGLILSVVGGVVLVACAMSNADAWRITGCCIFAMTLIAVYAFSTLSHCSFKPERVELFRRLDQGVIYLLIVGTYTPFGLAYLRTGGWWPLLTMMWVLALAGCYCKIFCPHRINGVAVWTYLFIGWLPIVAVRPLLEFVPTPALWGILIGGLCYTVGTVFLVADNKRFRFHAIWHLFVIAGSAAHFFTILYFVAIPSG